MAEQLATLLWELRTAAGWSLRQLARRAGVSKSALSQWEAGRRQPRLPELEATLDALKVTPAQRTRLIACIAAPRAFRRLNTPSPLNVMGPLPAAGDLLRALRLRRNRTQEQIAKRVGVGQNTVARWERGERLPSTEQMQALCFALEAHEEELVALTTGRFAEAPEAIPADPEATLEALHTLLHDPRLELVDLRYLTMERALWQRAVHDERAQPLLARAYAEHAHYLSLYERWGEVKTLAERALALTPPQEPTPSYSLRAIVKLAAAEVYGGYGPAPERGFHRLKTWLSRSSDPDYTAWMLSDMGKYLAMAGRTQSAVELGKQAVVVAQQEQEQEMRRLDHSRLLLAAGYPAEAMERLPLLSEDEGTFLYEALIRCEAYLALGERGEASAWLERAYAVMEAHGTKYDRLQIEALARRF